MAKNIRGDGERVLVSAAGARLSGVPVVDSGFFGFPMTDAASGASYPLDIELREHEVTISSAQTWDKGTLIYITSGNALTSAASGNRLALKVSRVVADGGVKTGKVWAVTLPQQA